MHKKYFHILSNVKNVLQLSTMPLKWHLYLQKNTLKFLIWYPEVTPLAFLQKYWMVFIGCLRFNKKRPEIHPETKFFSSFTSTQFVNSKNMQIRKRLINKVCEKLNYASNGVKIIYNFFWKYAVIFNL
jgi:hypothetical protein